MQAKEFQQLLAREYAAVKESGVGEQLESLSIEFFNGQYERFPDWSIGPWKQDDMLFRKKQQWKDPAGIGWESTFMFNPSLLEDNGRLYMFYRSSPQKESLASRIGLAWTDDGVNWTDHADNPIIYPTMENEGLSCEDPKIYKYNGRYYLFYNGAWRPSAQIQKHEHETTGFLWGFATDIMLAVSDDMLHWEKKGIVVPYEVSHYWAKAAVIPRTPQGEPVRINGKFLMYVSEGCGGHQFVGFSDDMEHWDFEQITYLNLPKGMGSLYEVSCAVARYEPTGTKLLLDFYYSSPDRQNRAAQAVYDVSAPFTQKEINPGGSLCWGGLIQYRGRWLFAQGWDAVPGREEMFFYSAEVKQP